MLFGPKRKRVDEERLTEVDDVNQVSGEAHRRWFAGKSTNLYVWYNDDDGSMTGFQLCYKRGCVAQIEKALTWLEGKGFSHKTVDDGESRGGRHKGSPVLTPDGIFVKETVLDMFKRNARCLKPEIIRFVTAKIRDYADQLDVNDV